MRTQLRDEEEKADGDVGLAVNEQSWLGMEHRVLSSCPGESSQRHWVEHLGHDDKVDYDCDC